MQQQYLASCPKQILSLKTPACTHYIIDLPKIQPALSGVANLVIIHIITNWGNILFIFIAHMLTNLDKQCFL
jgi:hypothetical protein